MKKSTGVQNRRQIALDNINKHLGAHKHEEENDIKKHKAEISVLEDRIKNQAKYRKILKKKPSTKIRVEEPVTA